MSEHRAMDCQDEHHDDLAAYSLGALPEAEARALEDHLAGCGACSERLQWLRPAVDLMPASVPQLEAPEGLKQRLMEVVNEEAEAAAAPVPAPAPAAPWWRRLRIGELVPFRPALAGLAALAIALVVVAGVSLTGGGGDESSLDGSYAANAVNSGSKATGLVRVEAGKGSISVENLPPTSERSTYQVWIGHDGQVTPSSTFDIDTDGTGAAEIPEVPPEADQILITREPAGGSKTPRGPQVLSADLS